MLIRFLLTLLVSSNPAPVDIHSYGNSDEIRPHHLSLRLDLDFDRQVIEGVATLFLTRRTPTRRLVLDTRELRIEKVVGIGNQGERRLTFTVHAPDPKLGSALEIELPIEVEKVRIHYRTTPGATALQWLEPNQTAEGTHPFLLTQSQSIHARSWIPCMDSPGVRITYDATVRLPSELMAVMSAESLKPEEGQGPGIYRFSMPQSIPPYLLALAAGRIEGRDISPRVRVYAEPSVVDRAAFEFADTEKMIRTVEKLYGPYRWGRYDLIVLPPSFPYGGMENPRLSFITPTVLAGDRSLVSLIAHELAHSWSGNLVTNSTWSDFWVNEGFTVYLERRVVEALYGREIAEMEAVLGLRDLEDDLRDFGMDHTFTSLHPDLTGYDPDDAFSNVPYEKGYLLLRLVEEKVGRNAFDTFLRDLFDRHAFGNLTTEQVGTELRDRLFQGSRPIEEELELDRWLFGTGLPENHPVARSDDFDKVQNQVDRFVGGTAASELDTRGWQTTHWLQFLNKLPGRLGAAAMEGLDEEFRFSQTGNSEIFHAWALHAIRNEHQPCYEPIRAFLLGMGRMKFLKPLYRAMRDNPATAKMGREIYSEARDGYHPLAIHLIDGVFAEESPAR